MKKFLDFPRGVSVDINNVPENFESLIANAFAEYTYGTAPDYTYQDKLSFIDLCRKYAHNATDEWSEVSDLIKEHFEYNLDECGRITSEDEFYSQEFMVECYMAGANDLNSCYTGDHHADDRIMYLLYRAIKVVLNWELPREDA